MIFCASCKTYFGIGAERESCLCNPLCFEVGRRMEGEQSNLSAEMQKQNNLIEELEALVRRVAKGECTCTLSHRLNGDGCEICNPELAIEIARENAENEDE